VGELRRDSPSYRGGPRGGGGAASGQQAVNGASEGGMWTEPKNDAAEVEIV
jgi:hypothetical protein